MQMNKDIVKTSKRIKHIIIILLLLLFQWWIQDFPDRGATPEFWVEMHENERNWTERGSTSIAPPGFAYIFSSSAQKVDKLF